MPIYELSGVTPDINDSAYIAESAVVIGNVVVADNASVWSGAVIRGDNELIKLASGVNVQEGAVLHTDPGYPMTIEADVSIGHQAMLQNMELKRVGSHPSAKGPEEYFAGTVRIDLLNSPPVPSRLSCASMTFEPGARSAWHTRPLRQSTIVTPATAGPSVRVSRRRRSATATSSGALPGTSMRTLRMVGGGERA